VTGRRRRTGGELWWALDQRALAYVRLSDASSAELPRHIEAIERLCDAHGFQLADMIVDVEGGTEAESAPPGLQWALAQLAAGGVRVLAVASAGHVTGAFAQAAQLTEWFREWGVTLVAADSAGGPDSATAGAEVPARSRRDTQRALGVGPRAWARYAHGRTDEADSSTADRDRRRSSDFRRNAR
jgi:Resolvase, N terminal domain